MASRISELVAQLGREGSPSERQRLISQLKQATFSKRVSLEKRGTVTAAARSELTGAGLEALHGAFEDQDPTVQRGAVVLVGDLGGASSVAKLADLCQCDDVELRLSAIDALGDIGGEDSISVLLSLASEREELPDVRLAALAEVEELVAKSITSGPDRRFDPSGAGGVVATESSVGPGVASRILSKMLEIQSDESAGAFMHLKAGDVRDYIEGGLLLD